MIIGAVINNISMSLSSICKYNYVKEREKIALNDAALGAVGVGPRKGLERVVVCRILGNRSHSRRRERLDSQSCKARSFRLASGGDIVLLRAERLVVD